MEFLAVIAFIVAAALLIPFLAGMLIQLPFRRPLPWQASWLVGVGFVLLFNVKGTTLSDLVTGPAGVFLVLWWVLYGSLIDLGGRLVRRLKRRRGEAGVAGSPEA